MKPQVGTVHEYAPRQCAFEFNSDDPTFYASNVVLFVGGLFDNLLTVPYLPALAESLRKIEHGGKWVLIQGLLQSAGIAWGTKSLAADNEDIAAIVAYLRSEKGGSRKRIVLMGHSTGCQDTISYITRFRYSDKATDSNAIDGGILQAAVSDPEALGSYIEGSKYHNMVKAARELIDNGRGEELLPHEFAKEMGCPISAYRFHSVLGTRGDDDYFSSYLTEEDHKQSFGKLNVPALILYGSKDECVPETVNREALIQSWERATSPQYWSPHSKVVKGATHNCGPDSDEGALEILLDSVEQFIKSL